MINDYLDLGIASHHVLELRQLPSGDEEVEHGAELLRLAPERITRLGVEPVVFAFVVDGTETHAGQLVLGHPVFELVGHLRVGRIDQALALEPPGVGLEAVSEVAVVPAMGDGLHQDAMADTLAIHLGEERFEGRRDLRRHELRLVGMGEREADRIAAPDMHVGIDEQALPLGIASSGGSARVRGGAGRQLFR